MSTQVSLPFDVTSRKHGGNRQSTAANLIAVPLKVSRREAIYVEAVRQGCYGITLKEVSAKLGVLPHTISGRITCLKMHRRLIEVPGAVREGCQVLIAEIYAHGEAK